MSISTTEETAEQTDQVTDQVTDWATCALPDSGEAASAAPLVSPRFAAAAIAGGAVLIDVRSAGSRAANGGVPQATVVDRTTLDETFGPDATRPVPGVENLHTPVVVICGSINGSGPVARELVRLGYDSVVHVDGAFPAWKAAGLPTTPPTETA